MRFYEFKIDESRGLMRRAQEVGLGRDFTVSKNAISLNLESAIVVPPDPALKYETQDELLKGIDQTLAQTLNGTEEYRSQLNPTHRAALILVFKNPTTNSSHFFIKFSNSKQIGNYPIIWRNSDFETQTGWRQTESKVSRRVELNLKPDQLVQTGQPLVILDLPKLINFKSNIDPSVQQQVVQLLENVKNGVTTPVPGAEQYVSSYEIDLGEIAAPIALATGNLVTGDYVEAATNLKFNWKDAYSVEFPSSKTNQLVDSILKYKDQKGNDRELNISSKEKTGGKSASISGIYKEIVKEPAKFQEIINTAEYKTIYDAVVTISTQSAVMGTLELAKTLKILTDEDIKILLDHYGKGEKTDVNRWTESETFVKIFNSKKARTADPDYDIGYHALAGVAKLVAGAMNSNPNTSKFFKDCLEKSNIVQVKTKVAKTANGAYFSNFFVIYPPVFAGNVVIDAETNFYANNTPKGKLSFRIG